MLSKSKYIAGLQCTKRLWLLKNRPDLIPPVDASAQARFDVGHQIGELAQTLFDGGKEVPFPKDRNFSKMLATTKDYLRDKTPAIYEAAFVEEGVLVLCDILVRTEEGFDCYEVKSSTQVKDYHEDDAAIQYYVLQKAGLPVSKMFVLTLNSDYVLGEEGLDLKKLFKPHDVTESVLAKQQAIPATLKVLKETLVGAEPKREIGPHCRKPFDCEFKAYCWSELPQPNIFDIPGIRQKTAWALYHSGKVRLSDLEPNDVKGQQADYVHHQLEQSEKILTQSIEAWLNELQYPLYFLDFETIMPAIPLWLGTKTYQSHFAVQYSLHVLREPGGDLEHHEYLADFSSDWRPHITKSLLEVLGDKGSILAYNQGFEIACLKRLGEWQPEFREALHAFVPRFRDLRTPFSQGWWYTPEMGGSTSIKSVYPALFPNSAQQYKGLVINNGGDASRELLALAEQGLNPATMANQNLRKDLLAYCELDTQAMVGIYRKLVEVVRKN